MKPNPYTNRLIDAENHNSGFPPSWLGTVAAKVGAYAYLSSLTALLLLRRLGRMALACATPAFYLLLLTITVLCIRETFAQDVTVNSDRGARVEIYTRLGQPPVTNVRTPMAGGVEHNTVVPGQDQGMSSWGSYRDLREANESAWGEDGYPPPLPEPPILLGD